RMAARCDAGAELGDGSGRGDASDPIAGTLCEPEGAVGSADDVLDRRARVAEAGECGCRAARADPAHETAAVRAEPQIAVGTGGDARRLRCGARTEFADDAGGRNGADLVGPEFREPEPAV